MYPLAFSVIGNMVYSGLAWYEHLFFIIPYYVVVCVEAKLAQKVIVYG